MLSSNVGSIYELTCNKREQPLDCPMASHENNKREHKHTKIIYSLLVYYSKGKSYFPKVICGWVMAWSWVSAC